MTTLSNQSTDSPFTKPLRTALRPVTSGWPLIGALPAAHARYREIFAQEMIAADIVNKTQNKRKPLMYTQTYTLAARRLSLLTSFLTLLLLFMVKEASASARALATAADSGRTSSVLEVDRTDDTAAAQACTDAPNDCSLRGAIIKANQQGNSTIFFLSTVNAYQLTIAPDGVNDATTGDLNITADLYIDGLGGRATCTPPDCQHPIIQSGASGSHWLDRIFRVENGAKVSLAFLHIRNGGHPNLEIGGGILVTAQAQLTLLSCRLYDHTARRGAGLAVEQGAVILQKSFILDNNAELDGGGLWLGMGATAQITDSQIITNRAGSGGGITNLGAMTLFNTLLNNNQATTPASGSGGAVDNQGQGSITGGVISNNAAATGGGINNQQQLALNTVMIYTNSAQNSNGGALANQGITATVTITKGYFTDNSAQGNGGAIWNAGQLTLIRNTFTNNNSDEEGQGGAIFHQSGIMTMVNSTISGNTASGGGGGLSVAAEGQGALSYVTIAQNFGGAAGGLLSLNPALRLSNTLLAKNMVFPGLPDDCTGSFTSLGYNLLERSSCTLLGAAPGDIVGQADGDVDAKLDNLQNSGFAVRTHALLPGSPAVNAGSPDSCPAIDQRGVARPQGGRCDIGAFEARFYYLPLVTR